MNANLENERETNASTVQSRVVTTPTILEGVHV